jgi:hypothetical protein
VAENVAGGVFAVGPGEQFDFHSAFRALDAAHPVGEEDRDVPERDELEEPRATGAVVSGGGFSAARTPRAAVGSWLDFEDDAKRFAPGVEKRLPVDKALDGVDFVEYGLERDRQPPFLV